MKKANTMVNFSSLVLFFLLFVASSHAAKVVEVGVICKQTKNPSFCSTLLNSKPGGVAGADLVTLAQYTIDVARANVTKTIDLINSLFAKSGGDPQARDHYSQCLTSFDSDEGSARSEVDYAQQRLKLGDYQSVNGSASAIMTYADDCVSKGYHDTSDLPKYIDDVEQVDDILLVISKYLISS